MRIEWFLTRSEGRRLIAISAQTSLQNKVKCLKIESGMVLEFLDGH